MRRCHITAPFLTDVPLTLARDVHAPSVGRAEGSSARCARCARRLELEPTPLWSWTFGRSIWANRSSWGSLAALRQGSWAL